MSPIILASFLTGVVAFGFWAFAKQSREGRIHTKAGTVDRRKSPRHFSALSAVSIWFLAPLALLMLVALWAVALAKTFG